MSDTLHRAVADASCIIVGQEDRIQRALQVLRTAQRYDLYPHPVGATMQPGRLGDWIAIDDIVKAIDILQEGRQ